MGAIVTTRGTCVVAVTGSATTDATADPTSFGASRILVKPVDRDTLLAAIGECFAPPPVEAPAVITPVLATP
jgi:DNA-binding NtrC family response regulator